jgi:FAD:protein FMN transferase
MDRRNRPSAVLLSVLLLSLAFAFYIRFSREAEREYRRTFPALGTFATVILTAPQGRGHALLDSSVALLTRLDTDLGRFSQTGALHRFNTTGSIALKTELGQLLAYSLFLSEATGGAFDPTLGALTDLWGFPEPEGLPDSAAIDSALALTGWRTTIVIGSHFVRKSDGALADLGAIAKGYAADRVWNMLTASGATECLVEIGGEIRCGGTTGRVWNIGIRHPEGDALAGVLSITEGAVATSGGYENFFVENGVHYSHLMDGRTGYPATASLSATVVADDCVTADAMATAAAVAGPVAAQEFPRETYRGMVIITASGPLGRGATHTFGEVPWQME